MAVAVERHGRLQDMDRSFDRQFWQAQGSNAIFDAAWQLVIDYYQWTGRDLAELEFQRSVEHIRRA
jgi:hypothetical protein